MTPLWAIYFCSFDFFCCFWWCLWGVDTMATLRDYMCDHFDAASFQRKKKNGIAATVPNERPRERVTRQCYADQESGTSTEQVPMKRSCSIRRSHPKLGQCTGRLPPRRSAAAGRGSCSRGRRGGAGAGGGHDPACG